MVPLLSSAPAALSPKSDRRVARVDIPCAGNVSSFEEVIDRTLDNSADQSEARAEKPQPGRRTRECSANTEGEPTAAQEQAPEAAPQQIPQDRTGASGAGTVARDGSKNAQPPTGALNGELTVEGNECPQHAKPQGAPPHVKAMAPGATGTPTAAPFEKATAPQAGEASPTASAGKGLLANFGTMASGVDTPHVLEESGLEPESVGTPAAQDTSPMSKQPQKTKTAPPPEQYLPVEAVSSLRGQQGEIRGGKPGGHRETPSVENKLFIPGVLSGQSDRADLAPAPASELSGGPEESRIASLERTHELIATHALQLRRGAKETLRVVITPGEGVRLSLELHRGSQGTEARVELQQGDFESLSRHWAELQQRLEARGIHLGDLKGNSGTPGEQYSFNNSANQREHGEQEGEPAATLQVTMAGKRPDRSVVHHGWESWA